MHITDRAGIEDKTVKLVADRTGVSERDFILFLDDAINAVRADHARAKLAEYRQKGWKPVYGWKLDATGRTIITPARSTDIRLFRKNSLAM